mgnify:CR=1 FL=1
MDETFDFECSAKNEIPIKLAEGVSMTTKHYGFLWL